MKSGGAGGTVYLHIYSDWTAGGTYGTPTGFVGSSTSSVTWPAPGAYATFSFNNLQLEYGHKYYALLSTTNTAGNLTAAPAALNTNNPYAGGNMVLKTTGEYITADLGFTASFLAAPSWTVNNSYGTQDLASMRIEALYSAGSYTGTSQQTLTGGSSEEVAQFQVTRSVASASLTWSTAKSVDSEGGSMLFTATNSSTPQNTAWAKAARSLGSIDITGKSAMGVWIHGDGRGEVLNFELRSGAGMVSSGGSISSHYVTVDFTGWRYVELLFREPDGSTYRENNVLDRANINYISISYLNLPLNQTVNCYISKVKALPAEQTTLENPSVTIAGQTITFPISMTSGQYIEFRSLTDCKLYDANGFFLQSITPTGTLPLLVVGDNIVHFTCATQGANTGRARVQIGCFDRQSSNWDAATVCSLSFDEIGGSLAVDASPYINDGVLSSTVQRVAGKSGYGAALQLNGIDAFVTVPTSESLNNMVGSFSAEVWFKCNASGVTGTLVAKNATATVANDPFNIYVNSSNYLCARVGNGAASYVLDSGTVVTDGNYHMVDLVYDDINKVYKLYVDGGAAKATQAVASNWLIANNSDALTLGYWAGGGDYFNGVIDQTQVLTHPLSQAEVQARFANVLPAATVTSPTSEATYAPTSSTPVDIPLSATTTDSGGAIKKVSFYHGDTWICDGVSQGSGVYTGTWSGVSVSDGGIYSVTARVTDDSGAIAISSGVKITIAVAPIIEHQPGNTMAAVGQSAAFAALAIGTGPLNYQWQKYNTGTSTWDNVSGATTASYTISSVQSGDNNTQYRVMITNDDGSATSDPAMLYVGSGVGWWKFDEGSGSTTVDSSGSDHTGTLINTVDWTNGIDNGAVSLDGESEYVRVSYSSQDTSLEYTGGDMTLIAWIWIDQNETTGGYVVSKAWNSSGEYNYCLYVDSSGHASLRLKPASANQQAVTSGQSLTAETWHHIVGTVVNTGTTYSMTLYIDGVSVASKECTIDNWNLTYGDVNRPLAIGTLFPYDPGHAGTPSYSFDGKIDTVRVLRNALGADAVAAQAGVTPNTPPSASITGPAADAVFNDPSGIAITVDAEDADGTIAKVDFYEDGNLLGTDTTAPFYWIWDDPAYGLHNLTAVATDEDGVSGGSSAVNIRVNRRPVLTVVEDQSVNEGQALNLANLGAFTDEDNTSGFTYDIDWGDGTSHSTGTATVDFTGEGQPTQGSFDGIHVYADNGNYTVSVRVSDVYGGSDTKTFNVTVNNVAPYLWISGDNTVVRDQTYTLDLHSSDPGDDTISHWNIDWGDGNQQEVQGNPSSVTHVYTTAATRSITATATDEDGTWATGGNAAGALDVTFDTDGVRTDPLVGGYDEGRAVAVQSDGKTIVAFSTTTLGSTGYDFGLARYNVDGSLDASFGTGGKVVVDFDSDDDHAYAVAIQSDGKIVVAGTAIVDGHGNFALARFNSDGTLDTGFGTDGKVTASFNNSDAAYAMAIQSDGKMVVAGSNGSDFAVARYNTDGTLDTTFDSDGKQTTDMGGMDMAYSVSIQSDGKIVVAGKNNSDFAIARYNTDGSLDTGFSGDGKQTTDFGGSDYIQSVAIQSDGKIVAVGARFLAGFDFAIARYNTDGSLDTSFDSDGKQTVDFGNFSDTASGVAIQSDGKILVSGTASNGFGVVRLNTNGSLDTDFDDDGKLTTGFGDWDGIAAGLALLSDGRFVVVGTSLFGSTSNVAVARYLPGVIGHTVEVT
jgi:uncharacterized delta-60 repeat protein